MSVTKYGKSPLTEVVCGIKFNAPRFSSVHFGLYWQTIKDRFSREPIDRPLIGEFNPFPMLSPTLPRVWFESDDQKDLIQLQSNCFYYNWRKQKETDRYPHFFQIYSKFIEEWNNFESWWSQQGNGSLQLISYELSYVNRIDKNFGWNDSNDNTKIFNFVLENWSGFLGANLEFELKDNLGTLSINLNQGITENKVPFANLALTTKSIKANKKIEEWFNLAYQNTVEGFLKLLSEETKQRWDLK